ncbi:MAG: 4Fe-4S dicluster domain-containing protein [Thermoplasmata archaeon]
MVWTPTTGKAKRQLQDPPFKFEGKLAEEVAALCGESFTGCYQCGTCSAGCPFAEEMDLTPDEVIRFVIMNKKSVLSSRTIWLCSSCFICAERCPRDINLTKVMEALRQIVLRQNIDRVRISDLTEEEKKHIPQIAFVSLFRKSIG